METKLENPDYPSRKRELCTNVDVCLVDGMDTDRTTSNPNGTIFL